MFLEIQGIRKSFGEGDNKVEVLKGIDLGIEKGEFCVLLGPSGSGKSTLLNIIGGIDSADEGNICIGGERMADMSERKLTQYRRRHLGYIFQMYNLIPNLTVRENIEVGAYLGERPLDVDELLHAQSALRRPAAADGHWKSHCQESGHPPLRRAHRRIGLPHLQGNFEAH